MPSSPEHRGPFCSLVHAQELLTLRNGVSPYEACAHPGEERAAARDGGAPASLAIGWRRSMIAISNTAKAYAAIKATLPEGADSWPIQPDGLGGVRIWLEHKFVDRLRALRSPGESYSDVIIRLAEEEDDSEE